MIASVDILLVIALGLLLIPACVLFVQSLMAFIPLPSSDHESSDEFSDKNCNKHSLCPRVAILIPAHNEEGGIVATLDSLLPQLSVGDRILVIADNCTDQTAAVARAAGAEVQERFDSHLRGKGYALDFGVNALKDSPPDVMIIVDADCIVSAGAIARITKIAFRTGRPVQALYLMFAPAASGPLKKIAEFAWIVKNKVRPLGFYRLGLPCQLMGTGMSFPWSIISKASLANGHIVEDMKLGMDLANAGLAPVFCPQALVSSSFPTSSTGTKTQRTRWEHGHLSMIFSAAPKLFFQGLFRLNLGSMAMALDLCVPPIALLMLLSLLLFLCAAVFALLTGMTLPIWLAAVELGAVVSAIGLSWWRYGRGILGVGNLLMAAWYMLGKLPLYLQFFFNRQVEWVRSKRDSE